MTSLNWWHSYFAASKACKSVKYYRTLTVNIWKKNGNEGKIQVHWLDVFRIVLCGLKSYEEIYTRQKQKTA